MECKLIPQIGKKLNQLRPVVDRHLLVLGERLNLELVKQFNAEGIRFALPSQTLYLDDRRNT